MADDAVAPRLPTGRGRCPFDLPPELARISADGPVSRLAYPDGPVGWLVTGYAEAKLVLTDARFSARQELRLSPLRPRPFAEIPPAAPGVFLGMDAPEQTRYRRALSGLFSPRRIRTFTGHLDRIVAEHVAAIRSESVRTEARPIAGRVVDLVPSLTASLPIVVLGALLGLPADEVERVRAASAIRDDFGLPEERRVLASEEIYRVAHRLVTAERTAPTGGMVGELVAAGELTDVEVTVVVYLLMITGQETMANMLAFGLYALLSEPGRWSVLAAHPERIGAVVEELLRHLTIARFGTVRAALTDVDLAGRRIRAGEVVTVSLAAANRDPRRFRDPDTLTLSDETGTAAGQLAFGHGVHQCLGQHLARAELVSCYTALLTAFPKLRLAVSPREVPMRDDRDVDGVYALPVTW